MGKNGHYADGLGEERTKPAYVFLAVPGCNGIGGYNLVDKLSHSLRSLREKVVHSDVYVYCGTDGTDEHVLEKLKLFCDAQRIKCVDFGRLKHDFGTMNINIPKHVQKNFFRLNVLIEKLYVLRDHSEDEDIVLVDVDTEFLGNLSEIIDVGKAVMGQLEHERLLKIRKLEKAFGIMGMEVAEDTPGFNSGVIYIPKGMRKRVAQEAIDMVIKMNEFPDNIRVAKDLDEQVAITVVVHKHFGSQVAFASPKYMKHFWNRSEPWWAKDIAGQNK